MVHVPFLHGGRKEVEDPRLILKFLKVISIEDFDWLRDRWTTNQTHCLIWTISGTFVMGMLHLLQVSYLKNNTSNKFLLFLFNTWMAVARQFIVIIYDKILQIIPNFWLFFQMLSKNASIMPVLAMANMFFPCSDMLILCALFSQKFFQKLISKVPQLSTEIYLKKSFLGK